MSQWVYELVCLQNSVQVYDIYLEISIGLLGVPKSMSDNLMRLKGGVYKFSSRVMEIRLDEMILIVTKAILVSFVATFPVIALQITF